MWLYVPGMESNCAPESECSAKVCEQPLSSSDSTIAPYVTLNGTHSQRPLSWRGWKTRPWIKLLYGTILKPLMADRGAARWIASLRDSLASPGAPPESSKASTMNAGCGRLSEGLSSKSNQNSFSLKMCRDWQQAAYLAGLVDGEGCISIQRHTKRKKPFYNVSVEIGMSSKAYKLLASLRTQLGGSLSKSRDKTEKWASAYAWKLHGSDAAAFINDIDPFLELKAEQAKVALELQAIIEALPKPKGVRRAWSDEARRKAEALKNRMTSLNAKGPTLPECPQGCIAVLHEGHWWTPQMSLFDETGLTPFSGSFPKSGSMRNGVIYKQPPLALRTSGSESSSWPTPRAQEDNCSAEATDARAERARKKYNAGEYGDNSGPPSMNSLNYVTQMWPTPHGFQAGNGPDGNEFSMAIRAWPTPRAEDSESCGNHPEATDSLTGAVGLWATPTAHDGRRPTDTSSTQNANLQRDAELRATPNAMARGSVSRGGERVNEPLLAGQVQMKMIDSQSAIDAGDTGLPARSDDAGNAANFSAADSAKQWATPDCNTSSYSNGLFGQNIREQAATWTPTEADFKRWEENNKTLDTYGFFPGPNKSESSLPVAATSTAGVELSPTEATTSERRRLNPAFVCWLMGWPWWWTRAERINFAAREMASYRARLARHLFGLCERLGLHD